MRVAFVQDSGMNESAALLVLSASLKQDGHVTRLFIDRDEPDLFGALRGFQPDVVLMAIDIGGHHWGLALADRIVHGMAAPLVLMGTYPTLEPDGVLGRPEFRFVLPGECDVSLPALLDELSSGRRRFEQVPGLCWRDEDGTAHRNPPAPYVANLDDLPAPDVSLFEPYPYLLRFGVRRFVSGRGCANRCSYCYNDSMGRQTRALGPYVRRKSAPRFVAEIAASLDRYPAHHVHMADDLFTHDPGWLGAFTPLYRREVGVPFTCNATPASLTEQTVSLLAEGGCHGVAVGIESGDQALRERILGRPARDDDLIAGCERVRRSGILLAAFNMLAMPGETFEQALSTIRLNTELGVQVPRVTYTFPIRGTRLTNRAIEEGFLTVETQAAIEAEVAAGKFKLRPCFQSPDNERFTRLFRVFQLSIVTGLPIDQVRRLVHSALLNRAIPYQMLMLALEKRFFRIHWLPGFNMFLHAGHPLGRTKNFNNFIP